MYDDFSDIMQFSGAAITDIEYVFIQTRGNRSVMWFDGKLF